MAFATRKTEKITTIIYITIFIFLDTFCIQFKTKVETYSDKINELEQRVRQLENASQS